MRSKKETIKKHGHYTGLILIIAALLFSCLTVKAGTIFFLKETCQIESGDKLMDSAALKPCELFSFTGKTVEGKIYVSWIVKSMSSDYYFNLERSFDGKKYSTVKIAKGFFSPPGQKLVYTFTDSVCEYSENVYYRLRLHKIQAIVEDCKSINLCSENSFERSNTMVMEKIIEKQKEETNFSMR